MFLFAFLLLLLVTNVYSFDQLPGINDIAAGYDAAKMLSASEQKSKLRIFDLSEKSTTPFELKVLGKDRTYTIPKSVQVTDVSVRKEDACETIAYTFKSFFRNYFRSTSFGIGTGVPGVMSEAVGYSETLKRIQEAISKNEQAVGISTTWWGIFSVDLTLESLPKLDPMFTQSVDMLAAKALKPTTEDHQAYYNAFIQTYGTHYVSRIIVGGTAHLYTLIASSYYRTSSYDAIKTQVGLMFQYQKALGQDGTSLDSASSMMTETFKKNTATISIFQPRVDSGENTSDWKTWQQTAADQPVVVNRTLFSLHDLITKHPTVREHLRKTIDYYLKTGSLPTLAQLNGVKTARLSEFLPEPIGLLSGLDVVGCGYSVLLMESKLCILDQSNFSENERWSDPYNTTLVYSIPNGWFAINTPESLTIDATALVTSVDDYYLRTRTVTVTKRGGWCGIGRKRIETTTTTFYRRFYQDYYNLLLRLKQIGWYTLSVRTFPYQKFSPMAQSAFDRLPTRFDLKDLQIWKDFFDLFGTHIVTSSNMGGQVWAETWYEKCLTYEHSQTWVSEQSSINWFGFESRTGQMESFQETVDERFKQYSISSAQLVGGTQSIDPSKWSEWVPTIKASPRPLSYRLISLDELLPQGNLRNALKAAIDQVLKAAEDEDRAYINQLESVRGPPPRKCSRNEIRTRRDLFFNHSS